MADPEEAVFDSLAGVVSPLYRGPMADGDEDDVTRVIADGGFQPQYLYGGGSVSNDDIQVLVRAEDYGEGRQRCVDIMDALSPSIPAGTVSVMMGQPFGHFQVDGDDRHYFSARFTCRVETE